MTTRYHINNDGEARKCAASFNCPFGDLNEDHYSSAAEARQAYEKKMASATQEAEASKARKAARRLGDPIVYEKPLSYMELNTIPTYYLDYDYDTSSEDLWNEDVDIVRDTKIDNVRIRGWGNNGEDLATYAKKALSLPADKPLPDELQKKLAPFVQNFNSDDYSPNILRGYYGEELSSIELPEALSKVIDDYYYAQPHAEGPENVLGYIRGKGYDTTGERPLEALKGMLQAENNGRVLQKIEKVTRWKKATLGIDSIATPSRVQTTEGETNPREPQLPGKSKKASDVIAGVVLQRKDGSYELIDGYHRRGWLKANKKKRANYIVLSHQPYYPTSYNDWYGE